MAECTLSGRSFQILGASYAKLRTKCFLNLNINAKCGTSRNTKRLTLTGFVHSMSGLKERFKVFRTTILQELVQQQGHL